MCARVRVAAGVTLVAGMLVMSSASRAAPARVKLFRPIHESELVRELTARTAGEVVAAGFSVELQELSSAPPAGPNPLVDRSSVDRPLVDAPSADTPSADPPSGDTPSVASIVISAVGSNLEDGQIDIAIGRQMIYRVVIRQNQVATKDGGRVLAAAAVRAVAILQTSLSERGHRKLSQSASAAPTPQPAPPSHSAEAAEPSQPLPPSTWLGTQFVPRTGSARLGIGVAVSVLQSLDGIAPTLAPTARISYRVTPLVSGGVRLTGLGTSSSATASAGSARIRQELALADVMVAFRPAGRLHPVLMSGAGVYRMSLQGSGTFPFVGRADRLWGAAAALGAGLTLDVGARISMALESHTLWVWPQPQVNIDSAGAGRAGRPSLSHSLGLIVWL
jgi:hypothetical protein